MTATQETPQIPGYADLHAQLQKIAENAETFNRLVNTDAKIAQTPKRLVWALNKTKLYRYVPVVPQKDRHRVPLLLVFGAAPWSVGLAGLAAVANLYHYEYCLVMAPQEVPNS